MKNVFLSKDSKFESLEAKNGMLDHTVYPLEHLDSQKEPFPNQNERVQGP